MSSAHWRARSIRPAQPASRTDDYQTHRHADVGAWFVRHPRITLDSRALDILPRPSLGCAERSSIMSNTGREGPTVNREEVGSGAGASFGLTGDADRMEENSFGQKLLAEVIGMGVLVF